MPTLNDLIAEHAADVVLRDDHFGVAATHAGGSITVLLDEQPREQDVRRAMIHAAAGVVADGDLLTIGGEEWRAAYVAPSVDGLQTIHAHLRLAETLTLQRSTYVKGPSGFQEPAWSDVATLRAVVRETLATRLVDEDRQEVKPEYLILIEEPPAEFGQNERLVAGDGTIYRVVATTQPEDRRLLFEATAEIWE